jgi:hypothetical protein
MRKSVSFVVDTKADVTEAASILLSMSKAPATRSAYISSCGVIMEYKDYIVMQKITSTGHFAKLDKVVENIFCAVLKTTQRRARLIYKMYLREKYEIEMFFS